MHGGSSSAVAFCGSASAVAPRRYARRYARRYERQVGLGSRLRGCLLTVVCTAAGCVVGCGNLLPGALLPDAPRRARGSAAELAATIPEHKIGVFVRFCPQKPSFSGLSSTKLRFLCAFGLKHPHFQAFRAQKWDFWARADGEWHWKV